MKVIFLDFDGVLNSRTSMKRNGEAHAKKSAKHYVNSRMRAKLKIYISSLLKGELL
jgi:hypothetical protein